MVSNHNVSSQHMAPKFRCHICSASFETIGERGHHQISEHGYRYMCGLCNLEFGCYEQLFEHREEQMHLDNVKKKGPRPQIEHRCGIDGCSESFPSRIKRGIHQINDHQKNFDCRGCSRKFDCLERLQEHLREINYHRDDETPAKVVSIAHGTPRRLGRQAISAGLDAVHPKIALQAIPTQVTTDEFLHRKAKSRVPQAPVEMANTETTEFDESSKRTTERKLEKRNMGEKKEKKKKRNPLHASLKQKAEQYKCRLVDAKTRLKSTKRDRKSKRELWASELSKLKKHNSELLKMLSET